VFILFAHHPAFTKCRVVTKTVLKLLLFFLDGSNVYRSNVNSTGTPFDCNDDGILQLFHPAFERTCIHPKEIFDNSHRAKNQTHVNFLDKKINFSINELIS